MPTVRLTKRNIEAAMRSQRARAELDGKVREVILWDDQLKGFGIRLAPSSRAYWLVLMRIGVGGSKAKFSKKYFDDYESLAPDKAREKASALLFEIKSGTDLKEKTRVERRKALEVYSSGKLKDVWKKYFEKQNKPGRYWHEVKRRFEGEIIPVLKPDTLVSNISKKDIISLLDAKETVTRSGARLHYAALSPFFKWCVQREIITQSPMAGLSQPKPYASRDRVLTDEELLLVWKAASDLPYPWGPFYKLLILTLQRRDEVANLPWSELTIKRGEWIIPSARTKNGKEHLVHLSNWSIDILGSMASVGESGETFVFTTASKVVDRKRFELPISGFSKAKLLLDAKIKELNHGRAIPEWRVHDLRRTGATGMGALGVAPHVTERILNHTSGVTGGLVGVYQRFEYVAERRDAMSKWANHISQLILDDMRREREGANVIAFERGIGAN